MFMLAEIADKMATIPWMWFSMGLFSILLAIPGLFHRYVAYSMFVVGLFFSITFAYYGYYQAFVEPGFYQAVQNEMGSVWIVNDIISSLFPFVFPGVVLLRHLKRRKAALQKQFVTISLFAELYIPARIR
jgi:hypothetical protein